MVQKRVMVVAHAKMWIYVLVNGFILSIYSQCGSVFTRDRFLKKNFGNAEFQLQRREDRGAECAEGRGWTWGGVSTPAPSHRGGVWGRGCALSPEKSFDFLDFK